MSQPVPSQRELVFCHGCHNEWYRDEHGIICPECHEDFCEVIEPDQDPRNVPDPDEDDIDQFEWRGNAPGEPPGGHAHIRRNITLGPGQLQGGAGMGGLLGLLGPAIQGILGGNMQQQQHGQAQFGGQQGEGGESTEPSQQGEDHQQPQTRSETYRGEGPGYAYTITTSLNTNVRPMGGLRPHTEAVDMGTMLQRMVTNIGVTPGSPMGLEDILAMVGGLGRGGLGDAVHSQEEYDRVISRLMEQHAAGNAPPPATAEAIEALPKRTIAKEDLDETGKADCSICISEVEIGEEVTVLPCEHWFHHECVKAWLVEHDTCPHCRKGIMPKDDTNTNRPRDPDQAPHVDVHSTEYQQPSSAGMFSRMREAFGSSSGTMGPPGGYPGSSGGSASGNNGES